MILDIVIPIGNSCPNFPLSIEVALKIFKETGVKATLDLFSFHLPPTQGNEIPITVENYLSKTSLSERYLKDIDFIEKVKNKTYFVYEREKNWAYKYLKEKENLNPNLNYLTLLDKIDPSCKEGVIASLTNRFRNTISENVNNRVVKKYIISWLIAYKYILNNYSNGSYTFHIWNGRYCKMTAVTAAAKKLNSKCMFFELSTCMKSFIHVDYSLFDRK